MPGYCPKCRDMMIDVNGKQKCFNCKTHKTSSKLVAVEVPSEKEFRQALKGNYKAPVNVPTPNPSAPQVSAPQSGSVRDALRIMKSLPMPDDIKDFKKIKKIIKQLEDLVGE